VLRVLSVTEAVLLLLSAESVGEGRAGRLAMDFAIREKVLE
jgi:hypothetical protein